jgi:acetyl esterase/lipase
MKGQYGKKALFALLGLLTVAWLWQWPASHIETVLLWPNGAPGRVGDEDEDRPKLEIFLPPPARASGTAILVCPGGGYALWGLKHKGLAIAHWLNNMGIAAFVLEYRVAPRYRYPAPQEDAERAMRFLRYHKADYGRSFEHIGIMGFSAGGHLAALTAAGAKLTAHAPIDAVDNESSRPDFAILGYPVVTLLPPYAHEQSVSNLLGPSATEEKRLSLSADRSVTSNMPPMFLFATADDPVVSVQNSNLLYAALQTAGVPVEFHVFAHGPHGFGLADGKYGTPDDPVLAVWTTLAGNWLRGLGMLAK